jgi:Na+-transporting methylmalonyl-CoA/oxaloacetate decarboxylase gamma subunit|tara:strand:- start:20 stop:202 length:183 start_codon:yes stop_codon:yes gene_type:complete
MDFSAVTFTALFQLPVVSGDMGQGLFVTWAGMAVVFSVLIVLILFMTVLGRVFKPGSEEE